MAAAAAAAALCFGCEWNGWCVEQSRAESRSFGRKTNRTATIFIAVVVVYDLTMNMLSSHFNSILLPLMKKIKRARARVFECITNNTAMARAH